MVFPRSKTHKAPTLFTGAKITTAVLYACIGPLVWLLLQEDFGSTVVRAVGGRLGYEEIATFPIEEPRKNFYGLWSLFFGLRWAINMFTANAGGSLPWGVAFPLFLFQASVKNVLLFVILPVMGQGIPSDLQVLDFIALAVNVVGGIFQTGSELQRLLFKLDSKNRGKVHASGLFSYARCINHFGFILYEASAAMASPSILWCFMAAFMAYYVVNEVVFPQDARMREKYGAQYEKYSASTPYLLVPFIF